MGNSLKSLNISGQTAVITGGAGVLGGAMVEELAMRGANVVIIGRNEEKAKKKAEEINSSGKKAIGLSSDVTDRSQLEIAKEKIKEEFGGIDILINAAGGNHPQATTSDELSFFDLPPESIKNVFDINCLGTILPCQVFGQLMVETVEKSGGFGNIISLSSMSAFRPLTRIPAYSAAKAAVSNFTQWLAVHMAHNYTPRIRVNAIAPGFFLTEQNRFLLTDRETGEFTKRGRSIIAHTPDGELGDPQDLISTLMWLLDPASRFITGTVVPVDGGFSAFSGV
jgi:NAD(P)-dependent dehydrogenase (short-subunit alcohol dehydrogenase family)